MKIQICNWKNCKSKFSEYITKRIQSDIEKFKINSVILENCGCLWDWECKKWPNVLIDWKIENYSDPVKISKIMIDKINQRQ